MVWMSLFSSALAVTAPIQPRWACELAPAYGQGSAAEGRVDNLTALSFGCGYRALRFQKFSLWPQLSVDTLNWSIYRNGGEAKELSSYKTQDLGIGMKSEYEISPAWSVSYVFNLAQGKGSLAKTSSTHRSSLTETYDRLDHRLRTHAVAIEHRMSSRFALSLAAQRLESDLSWQLDEGSAQQETVDDQQQLSLAEINPQEVPRRSSSRHASTALKLGLQFLID